MENIWVKNFNEINSYADFLRKFEFNGEKCRVEISADTEYALFINGKYVAHGQYADYPFYKVKDTIDVTGFVKQGENVLAVRAYHSGIDCSTNYDKPAGVAFAVLSGNKPLFSSDENVLSRPSPSYKSGEVERLTPQLGFSFACDLTAEDEWLTGDGKGFEKSVKTEACYDFVPRPIKKCVLQSPSAYKIVAQGYFILQKGETPAEKMQFAAISPIDFLTMTEKERTENCDKPCAFTSEDGDGLYVIADLGEETAGYLDFDLTVENSCEIFVGYGEHLADGRARTATGGRNFGFSIKLKAGRNEFRHYFRRIGGRYLQLFAFCKKIKINRFTLDSFDYPIKLRPKEFGDALLDEIYKTSERTLRLCMHEHYEDCPWREQALYGMDSRNQMLFGYEVFEDTEFVRASIRLMALSAGNDGLISLCAPARSAIAIPSFSLYWLIALGEYAEKTSDIGFIGEMLPFAEKIAEAFYPRLSERGVSCFVEPKYWNFYEWSEGLDGGNFNRQTEIEKTYDLISTALYILALKHLEKIEKMLSRKEKSEFWENAEEKAASALENFYDEKSGLYYSFVKNGEKYGLHAYALSAVLLTGCVPAKRAKKIAETLKEIPDFVVKPTLAVLQLYYDAIIRYGKDTEFVIADIKERFGKMLCAGATSFWETEKGEADFYDAGSLCHGWAAVPCYILNKYYKR